METNNDDTQSSPGEEGVVENGVIRFLEDFELEGGKIPFEEEVEENGSMVTKTIEKDFESLTGEEQYNVFNDLVDSKLEGRYELSEDEAKTIQFLRDKETTLESYVDSIAEDEKIKVENHYQGQSDDYKNMPDDNVHLVYLHSKYPDESDEELLSRHNVAKDLEGYSNKLENIRENLIENQELADNAEMLKKQKASDMKIETLKKEVVNDTYDLEIIAGWNVTENDLEEAYKDVLNMNEKGVSKFQEDVFKTPEEMIKASYLYRNAENLFNRMELHYKNKIADAFNNGKKAALNGSDIDPARVNYTPPKKKTEEKVVKKYKSFDDV